MRRTPAPSAVGRPARRQRTLVGFLQVSSATRHRLEQLEVAAGTLAPERTHNHLVWGPLALYSASPEALLKAKIGKLEHLTNYEQHMLFSQQGLNEKKFSPKGKNFQDFHWNRETWA